MSFIRKFNYKKPINPKPLVEMQPIKPSKAPKGTKWCEQTQEYISKTTAWSAKLKKIINTEETEQRAIFIWRDENKDKIKALRWLHSIPNDGYRDPATAKKMKATGATKGVADMSLPAARCGYCGLYIELKRIDGGAGLSSEQKEFKAFVEGENYLFLQCNGADEAIKAISQYLSGGFKKR